MGTIRFVCEGKLKISFKGECCDTGCFILVRNRLNGGEEEAIAGGC